MRAKGFKHSEETKLKMSISNKGRKISEETKRKMSKIAIKQYKEGKQKRRFGTKNPNWKGGVSQGYYMKLMGNMKLCSICNSNNFICIHHKNQNRRDNKESNLQVVCKSCHSRIHNNITNIPKELRIHERDRIGRFK